MFNTLNKYAVYAILQEVGRESDLSFTAEAVDNANNLVDRPEGVTKEMMKVAFKWLRSAAGNVRVIVHDFCMSENRIGGDDVIDYVEAAVKAERDGFAVETWYGPGGEVLIIGIKN